jgi:hypothetical protein
VSTLGIEPRSTGSKPIVRSAALHAHRGVSWICTTRERYTSICLIDYSAQPRIVVGFVNLSYHDGRLADCKTCATAPYFIFGGPPGVRTQTSLGYEPSALPI